MKKSLFLLAIPIVAFTMVVVVMPNNVSAQTTVVCPVGYTCTPIVPVVSSPTPVPIPPTTVYPPCYLFSTDLQIGSKGADVVALQTWLIEHGYDIPAITQEFASKGYYGPATAIAVKRYQASVGIESTGYFGPETRASVNASCGGTTPVSSVIFTFVNQNIVSNAGVADFASSSLTGTIVFRMKAVGGVLKKPVASDFTVRFDSGSGLSIPIIGDNTTSKSINITPADATVGDGGEYTIYVNGAITSANPLICGTQSLYMVIKDIDYTVGGGIFQNQTIETDKLRTNFATLQKNGPCITAQPSITVLSPNGGESFVQGNVLIGSFTTSNIAYGTFCEIAIVGTKSNGSPVDSTIATLNMLATDKQVFSGTIPANLVPVGNYKIRVDCGGSILLAQDQSDSYFTITSPTANQPAITILSPRDKETYKVGDMVKVKWATQNISSNAYLDIIRLRNLNLQREYSLASTVINDGNETVTIPSVPAGTYTLEIKSSVKGYADAITGSSDKFTIASPTSQPSITVLSPNGGEQIQKGSIYRIKWESVNVNQVYIKLRKGSDTYQGIEQEISRPIYNQGYFDWKVPTTIPDGSDYGVTLVQEGGNGFDISNGLFTITSSNTANRPPVISGGTFPTTLNVGETGTWRVNASDPENGPLSYSVNWGDYGSYGNVSAASSPITQTSTFTHSYSSSGTYTVKFIVTDNAGLSAETSTTVRVNSSDIPAVCPVGYICQAYGQTATCPAGYICTSTTYNCPSGYTCYQTTQNPTVTLYATPVASSDAVSKSYTVKWSSTNMNSCTLTTNATKGSDDSDNWSGYIGPVNTSGSVTAPVSGSVIVTVSCTGSAGNASKSVTLTGDQAYAPSNNLNAAIWDAIREYFKSGGR